MTGEIFACGKGAPDHERETDRKSGAESQGRRGQRQRRGKKKDAEAYFSDAKGIASRFPRPLEDPEVNCRYRRVARASQLVYSADYEERRKHET